MRKLAGILAGVVAVAAAIVAFGNNASAAGPDLVITGPGQGGPANVRTFAADGTANVSYFSKGNDTSGASVATGDVNGDGKTDLVTGTGAGLEATVQVWSGDGKTLIAQATPFPGFQGGIAVAAANEDATAQDEVIVAAGAGGGPHVKVLKFANGQLVDEYGFMAYDPKFTGGVFVAGTAGHVITGAGAGGGPHVRVFAITNGNLSVQAEWMAYDPKFTGGVHVAAGAVRAAGTPDVVTGAGSGGGPHVKLWSLAGAEGPGLMAYDQKFTGGVWVAVGAGQKLITGAGAGGGPHVKVISFANNAFTTSAQWMAYSKPEFSYGVQVGGFATAGSTPATTTTSTTACVGIPPVCLPGGDSGSTTTTAAPSSTTTSTTSASTTSTTSASTTSTTSASTTTSSSTTSTTAGGGLPIG